MRVVLALEKPKCLPKVCSPFCRMCEHFLFTRSNSPGAQEAPIVIKIAFDTCQSEIEDIQAEYIIRERVDNSQKSQLLSLFLDSKLTSSRENG